MEAIDDSNFVLEDPTANGERFICSIKDGSYTGLPQELSAYVKDFDMNDVLNYPLTILKTIIYRI